MTTPTAIYRPVMEGTDRTLAQAIAELGATPELVGAQ